MSCCSAASRAMCVRSRKALLQTRAPRRASSSSPGVIKKHACLGRDELGGARPPWSRRPIGPNAIPSSVDKPERLDEARLADDIRRGEPQWGTTFVRNALLRVWTPRAPLATCREAPPPRRMPAIPLRVSRRREPDPSTFLRSLSEPTHTKPVPFRMPASPASRAVSHESDGRESREVDAAVDHGGLPGRAPPGTAVTSRRAANRETAITE